MIKESLYFSFAGRKSSDFGIINVSLQSGLYEEPFMANRSIKETTVNGNDKPYFSGISRTPKSFTINCFFSENYNEELINEVTRWLNVEYYEPLFFAENIDKVFYALPVEDIALIHNGLKQGYLSITMRCDSPFSYSHEIVTPMYDCSNGEQVIEFVNLGTENTRPIIEVTKIGNGDLTIHNLSDWGREFKFINLTDKEELVIDCEHEEIIVNLTNTWRYDHFNDNYLSIPYGNNSLKVTGGCYLRFIYRCIFSN